MSTQLIRGTSIHYSQTGTGPDLFFVHGMCGDADVWKDQVDRLADRYTCTTYDRRGHSRSPMGDEAESDGCHAEDAAALIEALGLDPVVVASSGGARISVELLRRRPDLVRGAVLSEPPLWSVEPGSGQRLIGELVPLLTEAMDRAGPGAAVDAFFECVCPGLWHRVDGETKERYRANAEAMLREFDAEPNTITADDLAAIHTPVLLLTGTESHPAFGDVAAMFRRRLPDVRWMEFTDCGHVTYAEQPAQFATAVDAFAREVSSSPVIR